MSSQISQIDLPRDKLMEIIEESQIKDAYFQEELFNELKELKLEDKALRIYFVEPVSMRIFRKQNVKHIDFKTKFVSEKYGTLFVNTKRCGSGYQFYSVIEGYYNVEDFEIVDIIEHKYSFADIQKRLYDSQTWSNLKESDFIGPYKEKIRFVSINTGEKFRAYMDQIQQAFKNKTEFSFYRHGTQRDLSVNGRMVDGIYQAWYSSEYAGTGNGDYYLLLNPTTAVFVEHD